MKDAFGIPQSLLILGGTSEIALATARRLITRRTRTVWLAGRPTPALEEAAERLRRLGADARTVAFDALDPESHEAVLGKVFAEGDIDMVLMAFGVLGDQALDEKEPVAAVRVAQTNYTGAVSSGLVCARALQTQGHGSLVVLSSVAGSAPDARTSSTAPARRAWTPSRRASATPCTGRAPTSWSYAPGSSGPG